MYTYINICIYIYIYIYFVILPLSPGVGRGCENDVIFRGKYRRDEKKWENDTLEDKKER